MTIQGQIYITPFKGDEWIRSSKERSKSIILMKNFLLSHWEWHTLVPLWKLTEVKVSLKLMCQKKRLMIQFSSQKNTKTLQKFQNNCLYFKINLVIHPVKLQIKHCDNFPGSIMHKTVYNYNTSFTFSVFHVIIFFRGLSLHLQRSVFFLILMWRKSRI